MRALLGVLFTLCVLLLGRAALAQPSAAFSDAIGAGEIVDFAATLDPVTF